MGIGTLSNLSGNKFALSIGVSGACVDFGLCGVTVRHRGILRVGWSVELESSSSLPS